MENQKLQSLPQTPIGRPSKWEEKFLIKRIDEQDIEITLEQRNAILKALNDGQRFIQVGKYTLMLNGIKSIDPKWGANNIPDRPSINKRAEIIDGKGIIIITNQNEIDEWNTSFGE